MTDNYEEFMKVANEYYEKYAPEVPEEMRFRDFPWFETRSSKANLIYTRVGLWCVTQCFLSDYHLEVDDCFKELTEQIKSCMEGWMTEPTKAELNKEFRVYMGNMRTRMSEHDIFDPCPFCGSTELDVKTLEIICYGCGLHIGVPYFITKEEGHRCLKI